MKAVARLTLNASPCNPPSSYFFCHSFAILILYKKISLDLFLQQNVLFIFKTDFSTNFFISSPSGAPRS